MERKGDESVKILISDYPDSLMSTHDYEQEILKNAFPDARITIYEYTGDHAAFLEMMRDKDVLLTGFLHIDEEVLEHAVNLKCVALNATGYDNVDLKAATAHRVGVFPVGEYCTVDVAEHTIGLITALAKNIKHYINDIDKRRIWKYDSAAQPKRLEGQTLCVFGFGKIGRAVAKRAIGLGLKVMAVDPYVDPQAAVELGVEPASPEEAYERADIISNHMNLSSGNTRYFTEKEFKSMRRSPIFINMGRGLCVDERALLKALENGYVRSAGLDVLRDEVPALADNPLTGREDVIITPHMAFYSETSMRELQRISCENIVYYMTGQYEKVFKMVNQVR